MTKLKFQRRKINEPKLELVVDNFPIKPKIDVFKNQYGSLIDEDQWFADGELGGAIDYKNPKQRLRYFMKKSKPYQKRNGFTKKENTWFKMGEDPNYLAFCVQV